MKDDFKLPVIKKAPKENFRIIRVENGRKIAVEYFYAATTKNALAYLKKYKASHEGDFYWDYANRVVAADGTYQDDMISFDEIESIAAKKNQKKDKFDFEVTLSIKQNGKELKTRTFKKKFIVPAYKTLKREMLCGFDDFKFIVDNYDYASNSTHCRSEYWSIDHHVMNDILFNIERLKKNKHGCPTNMVDKARKQLNVSEADAHKDDTEDKVMKLAMKLWDDELDELALYIKLYQHYNEYGYSDDKTLIEKYPIPYLEGSYKNIDYKKLNTLTQKYWNKWIKKFGEIGQSMWD